MSTLVVENISDELLQRLKDQARLHGRSLSREVVYLVERGLKSEGKVYLVVGDRVYRETRASWLKSMDDSSEEGARRAEKRKRLFERIDAMGHIGLSDDIDSARLVREGRAEHDRRIIAAASYMTDEEKQAAYDELDRYVRGE